MTEVYWPPKDPDEVLDYDFVWTARLLSPDESENNVTTPSDAILSSIWTIDAATSDGALVVDSNENTGTITKVWLSGGTLGKTYKLTNRIVTDQGRTMEQSVEIKIRPK